jgi:5-hydroxyisourate hydrolase
MGRLSTHVLDTTTGRPAAGVALSLAFLDPDGSRRMLLATRTNADGRTDAPLLQGDALLAGTYELTFDLGGYFAAGSGVAPFLDTIPVRFTVSDPGAHYHVPLLVSPWSYTTYRGS